MSTYLFVHITSDGKFLDRMLVNIASKIFDTMIFPILTYDAEIWEIHFEHFEHLEKQQKKFTTVFILDIFSYTFTRLQVTRDRFQNYRFHVPDMSRYIVALNYKII